MSSAFFSMNYHQGQNISRIIIENYFNRFNFPRLLSKSPLDVCKLLVVKGIQYNASYLISAVLTLTPNKHDVLRILFFPQIIEMILLHDNTELYTSIIGVLKTQDETFVANAICDILRTKNSCSSSLVEKFMKYKNENSAKFFKKLGRYAIDNLLDPATTKHPKIFAICHGITRDDEPITIPFQFRELCFYVDKGQTLNEGCLLSKRVEEFICAGNYDGNKICSSPDNDNIVVDNLAYQFNNVSIKTERYNTIGIYYCYQDKVVNVSSDFIIHPNYLYSISTLINDVFMNVYNKYLSNVCEPQYVEVSIYACRSYSEHSTDVNVVPKATKSSPVSL